MLWVKSGLVLFPGLKLPRLNPGTWESEPLFPILLWKGDYKENGV